MRVFFSVGEPSGDLHGANLVRSLKSRGYQCEGYGGPRMQEAGCELLVDLTQFAVMFLNVLSVIPKMWGFYRQADRLFASGQYDAVVLIDYPGFNWWIAKAAKRHNVPVFYYGVPQMWAWNPGRVKKLRRLVDHVLCKLPFEVPWFQQRGCHATYVGHPYFDELAQRKLDHDFLQEYDSPERPLVTLLPGSRTQEVHGNLQWLVEAALRICQEHPQVALAVAAFNHRQAEYIRDFLEPYDLPIDVFVNRTPELIELSTLCLACSGSVSLELMYHQKPSIIVYRLKAWQALIKPLVLRCRFITLVNLLASDPIERTPGWSYDPTQPNQEVPFPEFPWYHSPVGPVAKLASQWLSSEPELTRRKKQLAELRRRFGQPGATARAAAYIDQVLRGVPMLDETTDSDSNTSPAPSQPKLELVDADQWQEADWAPVAAAAMRRQQINRQGNATLPLDSVSGPFEHQSIDLPQQGRRAA